MNSVSLSQVCKVITQACGGVVKILQCCDKLVTSLWQTWYCGHKVVVSLWNYCIVVMRWWQPCEWIDNVAARLQWDYEYTTRLWQGWQACDNLVTTLWRIRQCGCKVAVGTTRSWQGCGKVVTSLWQPCEGIDNVVARLCENTTRLWQGCDKVVARLWQGCKDSTTLSLPCHFCMGGFVTKNYTIWSISVVLH